MRYLLIAVFAMGIVACHTPDPEDAASHPPHHGIKSLSDKSVAQPKSG